MSLWASVDRPRAARPASSANGYRRKRGIWRNEGDRSPLPAAVVLTRNGAIPPLGNRAARSFVTSFEVTYEH